MGSLNVEKSPRAEGEGLPGLPLRAGGQSLGLGQNGRLLGGSDHGIKIVSDGMTQREEVAALPGLPLRAGDKTSGLGRTEGFLEAAIMESK